MTEQLHFHFSLSCIGEGNGNPLQCSCLENPRDGGAWWAAVYGVAQSRTRLKRLSSSSIVDSQCFSCIAKSFSFISKDSHRSRVKSKVLVSTSHITETYALQSPPCPLLSHVQLFVTPWTAAHQDSLSITNSWNLLELMSIESVMPSNHPPLLLTSIFPSIRVFPVSQLFISDGQSIEALASVSVLPVNIQG